MQLRMRRQAEYTLKIYFYLMKHKMSFRIVGAFNLSKSPLRITTIMLLWYITVETELKVTECALDVHTECMPFVKD